MLVLKSKCWNDVSLIISTELLCDKHMHISGHAAMFLDEYTMVNE